MSVLLSLVGSVFTVSHLLWATVGGVVTVAVPKVGAMLKSKVVAPAETKIASVQPAASAALTAEIDKVVAAAEAEVKKL
jgi:hypothetical protein